MKQFVIIFWTALVCNLTYSQTILDFFQNIPDSSILGLSVKERKIIAQHSIDNKTIEDANIDLKSKKVLYAFEKIDQKNGFLKLIGAFEGHIQMCYWKLKNGKKLIAIYYEGCGPECYLEKFDFYEYDGKKYIPKNWKSLIPLDYTDFLGSNVNSKTNEMEKNDISATLLFDLPQSGKNIIAKWGNIEPQSTYRKYGIGDRMILKWDDGKFVKGKIFWK